MLKNYIILIVVLILSGCSNGKMKTSETYYLRVPGSDNPAYMKVVIQSKSELGKVELRQGWYPAEAVDALFGDISTDGSIDAHKTKELIRKSYNEALITAITNYLNKAKDTTVRFEELNKYLKAISRVRLIARDDITEFENKGVPVDVIEYNPAAEIIQRRSGQKLVFVFSADPNSVISKIETFSASNETKLEINKLIGAFATREKNIVEAEVEKFKVSKKYDALITAQLGLAGANLTKATTREDALLKIDTLIILLESIKGEKQ